MSRLEAGRFRAPDGVELRFTRCRSGRDRAVLVVPGIFMHRDSAEHRLLAERLSRLADVITLDVRGHGDSGGAFSWGRHEPEDVAALARALRGEYRRLAGVGFSYGGYHIALAAAGNALFDAVALVGTPARLQILDHNFLTRGLARELPIILRRRRRWTRLSPVPPPLRRSPLRVVDRVAPTPLLIVHGGDDWLIPVKHAQWLYERAGEPKALRVIEGGGHAENMLATGPEPLLAELTAFLGARLGPASAGGGGSI